MERLLYSVAALLLATGLLIRALPTAGAMPDGPVLTGGSNEMMSFSGSTAGAVTLLTVPSDRVFILTGACLLSDFHIQQDNTIKVLDEAEAAHCQDGLGVLARGNGHVVFEPGSQVRLLNTYGTASDYYVQGYLAHP